MVATNVPRVADGLPAHKFMKILRKGRAGGHALLCCVARSVLPAATPAKPFFLMDGGWVWQLK
jgi:hypothetical protein